MCDFFSGIIKKDGKVLTHYTDSHEDIKKINKLDDSKCLEDLGFYPFEMSVKKGKDITDKPTKDNWQFKLTVSQGHSDGFKPKWFTKKHENNCWKEFAKQWNERVITGKVEEIIGKQGLILKNCSINIINNSTVNEMLDNSTVNKMLDNSTVNKMWENSTVNEMLDSSTVNKMWDSSTVNKMLGSSTVNEMWGNSTVNEMLDSSTVNKMLNNSTVNKMLGSSTVNEMLDNSTVNEMLDNSTVNKMLNNSTVKLIE